MTRPSACVCDYEQQQLRPCDDCPTRREHKPIEGSDFMYPEWCGACDACGSAPKVCSACSYSPDGVPLIPVDWPCAFAAAHQATLAEQETP